MRRAIVFGTDGWRGIIAEDFTFDNVRACAQAVAGYLLDSGLAPRGLVVGYDTRFASEEFAASVAEVVSANGIKTFLCSKAAPTPVISYAIVAKKAAGAVIITASHNPPLWNGFKYKPEYAGSASPEVVAELERRIPGAMARTLPLAEGKERGMVEDLDPAPAYLRHISDLVSLGDLRGAGFKVVVDSMYGAGAGYFKRVLGGGSTEVIEIHAERNPLFPGMKQPEPIAQNLVEFSAAVAAAGAGVGLAIDGDADRLGVVDERGHFIPQSEVFALLALYLLEVRGERGAIVKSVTATSMLYGLGQLFKVPVYEAPIGFKYIGPKMMAEKALLAGEESGGYGFRGHIPERDGVLAGLYFLHLMLKLGRTPSELVAYLHEKVGPHYYDRVDLPFPPEKRETIIGRLAAAQPEEVGGTRVAERDTLDGFRFRLADGAWLLVRFSGTEPLLRIYAEDGSAEIVKRLLMEGRRLAGL